LETARPVDLNVVGARQPDEQRDIHDHAEQEDHDE
jgi:hypothetical protein